MSKDISQTMKDFFSNLSERFNNAFIFSFVTAYLLFNSRAFLYLIMSDDKPNEKIDQFFYKLSLSKSNSFIENLESAYSPLIFALLYILVWPWVNNLFDFIKMSAEKNLTILTEKAFKDRRFSMEEMRTLRNEVEIERDDNFKLRDKVKVLEGYNQTASNEIAAIRKEKEELEVKNTEILHQNLEIQKKDSELKSTISELEKRIMEFESMLLQADNKLKEEKQHTSYLISARKKLIELIDEFEEYLLSNKKIENNDISVRLTSNNVKEIYNKREMIEQKISELKPTLKLYKMQIDNPEYKTTNSEITKK